MEESEDDVINLNREEKILEDCESPPPTKVKFVQKR